MWDIVQVTGSVHSTARGREGEGYGKAGREKVSQGHLDGWEQVGAP